MTWIAIGNLGDNHILQYIGSFSNLLVFVHRIMLSSILLTTSLSKYECDEYGDSIFIGWYSYYLNDSCPSSAQYHHIPFFSTSEIVLLATDPDIVFPFAYVDLLFIG